MSAEDPAKAPAAAGGAAPAADPGAAAPKTPFSLDMTASDAATKLRETASVSDSSFTEQATLESHSQRTLEDARSRQDKAKEDTRQTITLWLIGLLGTLIVLSFTALFMVGLKSPGGFDKEFFDRLKTLLDVLLGPVITLLSSAIGFYFGYQQATAVAKAGASGNPGPGGNAGAGGK